MIIGVFGAIVALVVVALLISLELKDRRECEDILKKWKDDIDEKRRKTATE